MCPLAVSMELGRCLVMLADVNPGQVAKLPLLMAFWRVSFTGLKQAWWRNWIRSELFDAWTVLYIEALGSVCSCGECGGGCGCMLFRSMVQRPVE